MSTEWIGVDLDGTLAEYHSGDFHKYGSTYIGRPIPQMLERVLDWLAEGRDVRIFTARVSEANGDLKHIREAIENWCVEHVGQKLPITNVKDYSMIQLWDDRAVQVEPNTGESVALQLHQLRVRYSALEDRYDDLKWRMDSLEH